MVKNPISTHRPHQTLRDIINKISINIKTKEMTNRAKKRLLWALVIVVIILLLLLGWGTFFGGDNNSNKLRVSDTELQVASNPAANTANSATPTIIRDTVYDCDLNDKLVALALDTAAYRAEIRALKARKPKTVYTGISQKKYDAMVRDRNTWTDKYNAVKARLDDCLANQGDDCKPIIAENNRLKDENAKQAARIKELERWEKIPDFIFEANIEDEISGKKIKWETFFTPDLYYVMKRDGVTIVKTPVE